MKPPPLPSDAVYLPRRDPRRDTRGAAAGASCNPGPAALPLAGRESAEPSGDLRTAFEKLVREHQQRIARLVYRLAAWSGEVDDIVQEVFMAAWRTFAEFRGAAQPATWLTRIAVNACRRRRRTARVVLRWFGRREPALSEQQNPLETNAGARPDAAAAEIEELSRMRVAMQALAPADREVVVLRYLEDLPGAETADVLGISRGAVDVRLHRALERLRIRLGTGGERL